MAGRFRTSFYCKQGGVFARTGTKRLVGASRSKPPAAQSHASPDSFDESEGPRAFKKPIGRSQGAGNSESENEPGTAVLECITQQHRCDREKSKKRERAHAARIFLRVVGGRVSQAVRRTSRGARGQIFIRYGTVCGALCLAVSRKSQPRPFWTMSSSSARRRFESRTISGKNIFRRVPWMSATHAAR